MEAPCGDLEMLQRACAGTLVGHSQSSFVILVAVALVLPQSSGLLSVSCICAWDH